MTLRITGKKGLCLLLRRLKNRFWNVSTWFSNFLCSLSHIGNSRIASKERFKDEKDCAKVHAEGVRCMVGSISKAWQRLQHLSPTLTNRRKKQKVIVYPFEDGHATVWHRQANNEFSWERNQSKTQKSANTDAFHTRQNVHCVPAAFCIDSQKLKYSPFSRCSPVFLLLDSPLMNWRCWTRLLREKKPKAAAIALPAPAFAKKTSRQK